MFNSIHHKSKQFQPGTRASIYYLMVWGMLSIYATYTSIDFIQRGVTETQWGIISALRALTIFFVAPQIIGAFALLLFPLPKQFFGFALVMMISAFFTSAVNPLGDGIVVRMAKKHDLEYGRLRLWGSLGFAVFGTAAGFVWNLIGFQWLYFAGFLGLLLVAFLTILLEEPQDEIVQEPPEAEMSPQLIKTPSAKGDRKKLIGLLLGDVVLLLFFLAALFRATSELMFFSFSGIYVDALTGNGFFTGLINNGSALLEVPVMLSSQKIIRKFSLESVITFGFVIQMLGIGLFAFTVNPWLMFIGSALRNAGFAFYFVAAVQFIDNRAAPGYATTYQGFLSSISWGLAPLIIAPLGGLIYEHWGAQWVFIMGTILSAVSVVIMIPVLIKLRVEKHTRLAPSK
jgi:PPP family 3-phenylpropionic acid transporter